jgi:hypothetical protein
VAFAPATELVVASAQARTALATRARSVGVERARADVRTVASAKSAVPTADVPCHTRAPSAAVVVILTG